jgi:hypothetical protein
MRNKEGRVLGLIGGLGPGATVYYYNGLLAAHKAQGRVARMLIAHADVDHGRPLAEANKLDELARYLNGFIDATAAGGARDGGDRRRDAAHLLGAAPAAVAHSADRHGVDRR